MRTFDSPRPDFRKPPVVEVVLSVQFRALTTFGISQFGRLWEKFAKEFPDTEDKTAIPSVIESFETPKQRPVNIEFIPEPAPPRCWFKNRDGTELLQVQWDRLIFNWKKAGTDKPYPRYEHVRAGFEAHFRTFESFLEENQLGHVLPNQCEVTYVNHLFPGQGWNGVGELDQIVSLWSGRHSDEFLPEPEDARVHVRYRMLGENGTPLGRLHVDIEPRITTDTGLPLLRMTLTARGAPFQENLEGVLGFFDLGREFVVRGFASLTTRKMHTIWERTDV